jgi:hypothetical protein
MAVAYVTSLRNTRMDDISAAVGSAGLIRFYDGTRPATGGAATTLLATLSWAAAMAAAAAGGVLTANAVVGANAGATGTTTWARVTTSGGTAVADMNVGTSGSDINMTTTAFVNGQPVAISSFVLTEGNP